MNECDTVDNFAERLRSGDKEVWEKLYRQYAPRLKAFAVAFVGDAPTAEDIVHDCIVKMWTRRDVMDGCSIPALLFTMVRNACLNEIKHRRIVPFQNIDDDRRGWEKLYQLDFYGEADRPLLVDELQREIDGAVDRLPERTRRVFVSSRDDGMKNRDIARQMDISMTAVENHIKKGCERIKNHLVRCCPEDLIYIAYAGDKRKLMNKKQKHNTMNKRNVLTLLVLLVSACTAFAGELTQYVNPFLGTATLWDYQDLHYVRMRKTRTWGGETFPGSSLPCAMVQTSPVTMFRSGGGYQYEDKTILGFAHTNKGHWNLLHVPLLPVNTATVDADDYASPFSHNREEAHPGYYRVMLDRYGIKAELTSTLRCAFHRYTFIKGGQRRLIADMKRSNNHVLQWNIEKSGDNVFSGFQDGEGRIFFYAVANAPVKNVEEVKGREHEVMVVSFGGDDSKPLELRIGFSFTSVEGAKRNLEKEMLGKSFSEVRTEADQTWESLLSKIKVDGGTDRQKRIFYSCMYRSMMWPALRSDVDGKYTDVHGNIVNNGFLYYTNPSFWDDYRNKLILLGLLMPDVATDVIKSITDKGEKQGGYMPTFFHGDHASTFVAGSWLRGIRGFDLERAYKLLLKNATVPGRGGRPFLDEYMRQGWVAEKDTTDVPYYNEYKAAVTKTVEYAYDDYATALLARELGRQDDYAMLMKRTKNYRNVFDPSTGFFRGRIADGSFIRQFDPYYPYFAYQFREANAWQSLFFAPHDPEGIVSLYPGKKAVEDKLDSLFSEPWRGYEVENLTGFIGNYCHGNQPGHSQPYMYYFVGKQEKAQCVLDSIMNHYYDMGRDHLALAGMDDAGEMTSWFVCNAIGLYTYSPADPEYLVTVPLFRDVKFAVGDGKTLTVRHEGQGLKITSILYNGRKQNGWFFPDSDLKQGGELVIKTVPSN